MTNRRLSTRLTGAAVAAVLIAVLVLGVGARLIVANQLRSSLDKSLRQRATDVARLSVSAPAVLQTPGALEAPASGRQLSVELFDRKGAILARSLTLGAKLLPQGSVVAAAARGHSGLADASLDGKPLRLFAAPIADVGGPAAGGVVLVAADTTSDHDTEHQLSLLLVLCGLLAAGIGGAAAALLTRRGLRPLQQLSVSASTIERTGDPSRRLTAPAAADELGELAATLNRMLGALEAAGVRERRFLADASHELRTPLTSLAGNVEYLARHGAEPEVIEDLQEDASRLRQLLDDLLTLERETALPLQRQPVDLDAIVEEALREHSTAMATRIDPAIVHGERAALRRALENLLENAETHGTPGGRVSVALQAVDGHAELSVSDEGPGFEAGDERRAFERFWRGDQAARKSGSGLGLAIVKATAERHGGSVRIDGSTVTIELPLAAG